MRESVDVPIFEVTDADYRTIEKAIGSGEKVVIYVGANERSELAFWRELPGIFLSLIGVVLALASIIFTLITLGRFIKRGFTLNVATVCLILHLIASFRTLCSIFNFYCLQF